MYTKMTEQERYAKPKSESPPISYLSQTRLLPTKLLSRHSAEILVQCIRRSTALLKLHNRTHIPIGPHNNHTALVLIKPHLRVRRGLRVGDAHVPHIVCIDVVCVARQDLGQLLVDVDLGAGGIEDDGQGEEGGVRVVLLVVAVGGVDVFVKEVGEEG